jgi:beta-glucosidase
MRVAAVRQWSLRGSNAAAARGAGTRSPLRKETDAERAILDRSRRAHTPAPGLRAMRRSPARRRRADALCSLAAACVVAAAPVAIHPEIWPQARSPTLVDPPTELRIGALIAAMTLEEKVGQVIQTDVGALTPADLRRYPLGSILSGGDSTVDKAPRSPAADWLRLTREFHAVAREPRPGHVPIPLLIGVDAVHGHNHMPESVVFPHNSGLGAAHDEELVRRIGVATARMVAATGFDWTFAPVLAVPRDPRWGRTYEGYSSDPELVRRYGVALVLGLQGPPGLANPIREGHVAATAKHFLGDGATLYGEDEGDAVLDEAELARVHAAAYGAAIDAGVMTVMASYSSWNGDKMHASRDLLTRVLKEQMGFAGFVVGDWNGHAQVPGCNKDSCAAALNAGLDMFMAPLTYRDLFANVLAQVRSGVVPMARLDDAVRRILRVKYRLGLFEPERPLEGALDMLAADENRALAREAVRKSLVLLKNDGVLPIRAGARVLIAGPQAGDLAVQTGGWTLTWQGMTTKRADYPAAETIPEGIKAAVRAAGGTMVEPMDDLAAHRPDVAIVIFGELPYAEMTGDLKLPLYNSRAGLREVNHFRSLGIPVVSVFLSGRPLWVNPEINASDAFVVAWLPGTEGGGVADVLVGDRDGRPRHDFSGTLAFPWPESALLPPFAAANDAPAAAFPLGYGLGYAHPGKTRRLSEALGGR